jgi:hypothetical protein
MWFGVWPRPDGSVERSPPWTGEGFTKEGEAFAVKGAAKRALLRYDGQVRDAASGRSGLNEVGDVRVRFSVEGAEAGTVLVVRLTGRAGPCEVRATADGSRVEFDASGSKGTAGTAPGAPIRDLEVSFADLLFEVKSGGRTLVSASCSPLPDRARAPFAIAFGVDRGGASFRDVRLDRDVFYTGSHRFEVPEGRYLFLGDNSGNSMDSRAWRAYEVREAGEGGRVFYTENRPYGLDKDGKVTFKDRNHVVRSYLPSEVKVGESAVPMSFVPAEDLHGRAFAIFWPPRWFTKFPGGRVGILP